MSSSENPKLSSVSNVIHVTGFGPFRGFHITNPSWEAVSLLPDEIEYDKNTFRIKKHRVSVEYDAVNDVVPTLWSDNPTLVIHCGVSDKAKKIHLEQYAFNNVFVDEDCMGKCLNGPKVCLSNASSDCERLGTTLDLVKIIGECKSDICEFECSADPGNYLCDYIYLKSLDVNPDRCLFIHVPNDKHYTVQVISDGILSVIYHCLKQLHAKNIPENVKASQE